MIQGLGTDIIEIERVALAIEKHKNHFLNRIFTQKEQKYCNQFGPTASQRYAGRFAAKEAIAKAIGCGIGKELSWLDIEILPDAHGKPVVACKGHFFLLSISHSKKYATATAIKIANPH